MCENYFNKTHNPEFMYDKRLLNNNLNHLLLHHIFINDQFERPPLILVSKDQCSRSQVRVKV